MRGIAELPKTFCRQVESRRTRVSRILICADLRHNRKVKTSVSGNMCAIHIQMVETYLVPDIHLRIVDHVSIIVTLNIKQNIISWC